MKNRLTNAEMEQTYEDQLLQNYEFYKSVFELSKDPKLVLEGGIIVKFNSATLDFFECDDPDKIFGHELAEFIFNSVVDHGFVKNIYMKKDFVKLKFKTCKDNVNFVTVNFDIISRNGVEKSIVTICGKLPLKGKLGEEK